MSHAGKIVRRTLLIGAAAVAAGVALGIYEYKNVPTNPLLKRLRKGQTALTPYVRVDQSG
jgi:isoquinoline 1-oxidoreductase subunit beta